MSAFASLDITTAATRATAAWYTYPGSPNSSIQRDVSYIEWYTPPDPPNPNPIAGMPMRW